MASDKETLPVEADEEEVLVESSLGVALFWLIMAFPYVLGIWFLGWRWCVDALRGEHDI